MPIEFDPARRKFIQGTLGAAAGLIFPQPIHPPDFDPHSTEPSQTPEPDPSEKFYAYLSEVAKNIPDIGGDEKYYLPLNAGVGYATLHCLTRKTADYHGRSLRTWMSNGGVQYSELTPNQRNIYTLTDKGIKGMAGFIEESQDQMDIATALVSDRYVGLIATRSPKDIGAKYLAFGTTSKDRLVSTPKFIGVVLVVDCIQKEHWLDGGSSRTYSYQGWRNLPWITEASPEVMEKFPPGVSGDPKNINCGRPGVVLISESVFASLVS